MSLATYADLQTQITNWLGGRSDLTTFYPDWITAFEAYAARKLRVRPMETTATLTPVLGVVALPSNYLGWRRLTWTGYPRREIPYVGPSYFSALFPTQPTDSPTVFTIEGSNIKTMPIDSNNTQFELLYYAKNAALSSSLNWLYTNFPDAYLWGSLLEAMIFTRDDDGAVLYKARRDEVMNEVSMLNFREQGANMAPRMLNPTP